MVALSGAVTGPLVVCTVRKSHKRATSEPKAIDPTNQPYRAYRIISAARNNILLENRRFKIVLRALAIVMAAVLLVLTVVPAADRPDTGIQHDVEHFGAFLLPGLLFAFGFEVRTRAMLLMSIAFSAILECMQVPLETRHARLEDFFVDAAGMCAGILIARFTKAWLQRTC